MTVPTPLTIDVMNVVWTTLDALVRNPEGNTHFQIRAFDEACEYMRSVRKHVRDGRSTPNFANATDRLCFEQCERFIMMLTPLYSVVQPAQDRT
jgi:hypothetical protein